MESGSPSRRKETSRINIIDDPVNRCSVATTSNSAAGSRSETIVFSASASRGTLQGIGCFDGFYIDWVIENNLVVTDHWHGITLLGADGCRVVNNTVVDLNAIDPGPPWVMISDHKDGRPSVDCLIRNNIARMISAGEGVVADHNLETIDLAAVFEDPAGLDFRLRALSPHRRTFAEITIRIASLVPS